MFNIIKRKKPLHIRCLTAKPKIANLFPPKKLSQDIPEWWKNTPAYMPAPKTKNTFSDLRNRITKLHRSAKHCYAMQETFKQGIGFYLWSDAFIEVAHNDRIEAVSPDRHPFGSQHDKRQYPGLLPDNYCNYKLNSPWMFYTEEHVPFWMCDPFYHKLNRDWQTMNGVVETYYQHTLNVNLILRKPLPVKGKQKEQRIQYEFCAGDCIAYLIPMTHDRKIILTAEEISEKEWEKLRAHQRIWFRHHREMIRHNQGGYPTTIGGA